MTIYHSNFLQLAKQVDPPSKLPWLIIETFISSDGFRTRVCNGRWATEEEARQELERKEALRWELK